MAKSSVGHLWPAGHALKTPALKDQGQHETARYWLRFILHISKIQVTAVPTHLISDVPVSRGYVGFKEKIGSFCEDGKNL